MADSMSSKSKKGSPLSRKRYLAESGESSKPKKSRRGPDPLDTIRFRPLKDGPMITADLVEFYTRQFGQDLFMKVNKKERYIDVRFADKESADSVERNFQLPWQMPPFDMVLTNTIDGSQIITPGEVKMYQPPRDLDHDNTQPSVPLCWNNPHPVIFEFPEKKDEAADDASPAADESSPAADLPPRVQKPKSTKPRRQPRVIAKYPPTAQPPPPSSRPPFREPKWPTPPPHITA
ncbi:hypothetical protein TRIUR3_12314 [Triticum urartu]|uniref:Uncharacterized protein n=2 Tax=Triticum urartu TaxID=4572 RepID=M7Z1R2_TRIUA|nr:hypothetical protein TRIUR3_12314 [Triticum urartu]